MGDPFVSKIKKIMKNQIDLMFRQFAFNLKKGTKILAVLPVHIVLQLPYTL